MRAARSLRVSVLTWGGEMPIKGNSAAAKAIELTHTHGHTHRNHGRADG